MKRIKNKYKNVCVLNATNDLKKSQFEYISLLKIEFFPERNFLSTIFKLWRKYVVCA